MGEKLSKAPVYFTIFQVRFNSIQIDTYIPDIQEKFRKAKFPDAKKSVLSTINLNFGVSSESAQQQAPSQQHTIYTYSNFDKTACFVLDKSSLTFQTTAYDRFETISPIFFDGLNIINESLGGIDFVDRVGFRYLDAFEADQPDKVTDYLNEKFIGLFGENEMQVTHSFTETVYRRDSIDLTARTVILNSQFGMPMDVQPGSLVVGERFTKISGTHAMLDIDGSVSSRQEFSLEKIKSNLSMIHDEILVAFYKIITPLALEAWK